MLCIITLFSIVSLLHLFVLCLFFIAQDSRASLEFIFCLIRISGITLQLVLRLVSQKSARVHFPESGISESASEDYQAVLSTVIAS